MSIGQVTYSIFPAVAQPGQVADFTIAEIRGFPAIEVIQPGAPVQMASDGASIQQVQGTLSNTTTVQPCVGVSCLKDSRENTSAFNVASYTGAQYNIGDIVPVMRKGTIYGAWSGTTIPANGAVNIAQSSTTATARGYFTDAAASTTAGSEISPAGNRIQTLPPALPGSGTIVLLEVNFPSAL